MRVTREQAALLLGVDSDASAEQVNHAWRVWVKLAHPDTGGDREHFEALAEARSVLLRSHPTAIRATQQEPSSPSPAPRTPLRDVCCRPGAHRVVAMVAALLGAIVVAVFVSHVSDLAAAVAVGVASCGVAITIQRSVLTHVADTGHRITILTVAWLPVAAVLAAVALLQGVSIIGLLPVVALPFAVSVGLVNPGAGLWRPIRRAS